MNKKQEARYQDFFQGLGLRLWREATSPEETEDEVAFLIEMLELEEASAILDAPCGFGRHALMLAALGHQVSGVDLSPEYLEELEAEAGAQGLQIALYQEDLREMSFSQDFDAAYCLGNSFAVFDYAESLRFLEGVAEALRPGGRFLLESAQVAEAFLPHFEARLWREVGDMTLAIENHYEPEDSKLVSRYHLFAEGRKETREIAHWVFTIAEVKRMLETVGLIPAGLCADSDGNPFVLGCERAFFLAIKA